jgi:uncharacterized membrane protein
MHDTTPLVDLSHGASHTEVEQVDAQLPAERAATIWVSRLTGIVGAIMLVIALLEWFVRHGHLRLVLALLTVAMFCAILHSYVFEDGSPA